MAHDDSDHEIPSRIPAAAADARRPQSLGVHGATTDYRPPAGAGGVGAAGLPLFHHHEAECHSIYIPGPMLNKHGRPPRPTFRAGAPFPLPFPRGWPSASPN